METVIITKAEYDEMQAINDAYQALKAENVGLQERLDFIMAQMRLARRKQYGSSSEKSEYDQLSLFDEAEAYSRSEAPEPEMREVKVHYRKRARESKERLPEDLPLEIVEHRLPEAEQVCPECGEHLHEMGKTERDALKLIPAQAIIERHIRYT